MSSVVPAIVDEVPVKRTWERLAADPEAVLIDVRTRAEWAFVGLPDLSALGRKPVLVEWQHFPENRANPDFVTQLRDLLDASGVGNDADLYFLCRSGGRSLQAAKAMAAVGYQRCHNVTEGFEGPLDQAKHRGTQVGWKAEGLPWQQG